MVPTTTKNDGEPFHMVAMAYPGRGHIDAMMNFCCLLSDRGGFRISFVVTEEWSSILSSDTPPPPCVHLCTIPNFIPSERGRAADMNGFFEAVQTKMEEPFERLITEQLELPVQAIVSDTYLTWVVAVGNRRGIPVCSSFPMGACFFHALNNYDLLPIHVPTSDLIAGLQANLLRGLVNEDKRHPEINLLLNNSLTDSCYSIGITADLFSAYPRTTCRLA